MSIIYRQIDEIREYFTDKDWVRAIGAFGSYGRRDCNEFSDIDLYIFGDGSDAWRNFCNTVPGEFSRIFNAPLPAVNYIPKEKGTHILKEGLWIIFTPQYYTKIEVHLYDQAVLNEYNENIAVYFIESRIPVAADAVILDKDGKLRPYLEKNKREWRDPPAYKRFITEIAKFLNYYELFYNNFCKGDLYRAYFHNNLMLYKIAILKYLEAGNTEHLYLPKCLFARLDGDPIVREYKRKVFNRFVSDFRPANLRKATEFMFDTLLEIIENSPYTDKYAEYLSSPQFFLSEFDYTAPKGNVTSVGTVTNYLRNYRKMILQKYNPFYNFRDIARPAFDTENRIVKGVLYRCAALSRYDTDELLELFGEKNIDCIIDMRIGEEIEKLPYPPELFERSENKIRYVNIPIMLFTSDYIEVFHRYKRQFYKVLKCISEPRYRHIILHCVYGVDRTGIAVALIYSILGIGKAEITEDFMLGFTCTDKYTENLKRTEINRFLEYIERTGGIEKLFGEFGDIENIIVNIRKKLLNGNSDTILRTV